MRERQKCNNMPHSFHIYLGTNVSPKHKRLQELFAWAEFYRVNGIVWRDGRNIPQELEDEIDNLNNGEL